MGIAVKISLYLLLILFLHALLVSIARWKTKRSLGVTTEDNILTRAHLAHRQQLEYVPALCLLMLISSYYIDYTWIGWVYYTALFARVGYSIWCFTCEKLTALHWLRGLSTLLTYAVGFFLSIATLLKLGMN